MKNSRWIVRKIAVLIAMSMAFVFAGCDLWDDETSAPARVEWVHPSGLDNGISTTERTAYSPAVATDDAGNAIVVWQQRNDADNAYEVYRQEYRSGSWRDAVKVSVDNATYMDAISPKVAMGADGDAVIVWLQRSSMVAGHQDHVVYRMDCRDNVWASAAVVSDIANPSGETESAVAMNASGETVVVWGQKDEGTNNWRVFKSEYRAAAWSAADNVSPYVAAGNMAFNYFDVAMDDEGNAIITWNQDSPSRREFQMTEYRGTAWSAPVVIDNTGATVLDGTRARVEMDNARNAVIVWEQNDSFGYSQIYRKEYHGGPWFGATALTSASINANNPDVAVNDDGDAVLIWRRVNGPDGYDVIKTEYRDGEWDAPVVFHSSTTALDAPQVAMDAAGDIVITWSEEDHAGGDSGVERIFKSEYRNGVWTHPASIDDYISPSGGTGGADSAVVSMSDSGVAIIAWQQYTETNMSIFKSTYDPR